MSGLWCCGAGHNRREIADAITTQLGRMDYSPGFQFGHPLSFELANRLKQLTPAGLDYVFFSNSGSEAVETALKMARAYWRQKGMPGKTKLIGRAKGYHGVNFGGVSVGGIGPNRKLFGTLLDADHLPHTLLKENAFSRGVPAHGAALADQLEELVALHDASNIAAVVVEPVAGSAGVIVPPEGYLQRLREICDRHAILLIFDEVITGFRIGLGGAQEHFGVVPDLSTLGKALAGGITLSAVAGSAEIMELMAAGGVSFGGTFNGNPMALAAAHATLEELSRDDGAALARANAAGLRLMEEIRGLARERGLPLLVTGFGASFSLHFTPLTEIHTYRDTLRDNAALLRQFLRLALDEGIYLLPDGRFYVSAVHTEKEEEETVQALRRVFSALS
jgi:beta-alanine--pyruvate transaminase